MKNKVFIATSLDGYIADKNGGIEWLHSIPATDDMGYEAFTTEIDALVMGRTTFETVCGFGIPWPYAKPVFVLSTTLTNLPEAYKGKVFLLKGSLPEILAEIHKAGHTNLYIDGGRTVQNFLQEDLIDEITITVIPILLGSGIPLFGPLTSPLDFKCTGSKIYLEKYVQNTFARIR